MSETSDIETLVLAAQAQPQITSTPDGRTFALVPTGQGAYKLEQVSLPNAANVLLPKIVNQHVKVQTAQSLADYINRFKNTDTVLFADIDHNSIQAIIDYHLIPDANGDRNPKATLGAHRATLALPFSLEWQTWTGNSGKLMSHVAFATFLEENAVDIVSPPGADLLELCRDLQVAQNVNFGSSVRMGDITQLEYKKESDALSKGTIALPQSIMLSIPVYFGEAPVSIMAFMRRQIEDGKLRLGVALSRAENVRQGEFHRIVDAVTVNVDHLTTVYGSPQ